MVGDGSGGRGSSRGGEVGGGRGDDGSAGWVMVGRWGVWKWLAVEVEVGVEVEVAL